MKRSIAVAVGLALLGGVGGCPLNDPAAQYQSAVDAQITISTTTGEAPLHVFASAAGSISPRGAIVKYHWDFAGEATSDNVAAEHTFTRPGRYPITLTIVDVDGEQAAARIHVRVKGGDVTAVINASRLSGVAPLGVQFDGAASTAIDDTILDYYWDFGDTESSRIAAPFHTFQHSGEYVVKLRAISAGGVEGYAETTVTVDASDASDAGESLQFNGVQYANLPVASEAALGEFTFETWCKPDAGGGVVVNFGSPNIAIDVTPGTGLAVRNGQDAFDFSGGLAQGQWSHLAVSYSDGDGVRVYLNGEIIGTAALSGEFTTPLLSLGAGFHGALAKVRFWSAARSDAEIATDVNGTLTGFEEGLLGDWPLDSGSGQTLENRAYSAENGVRGSSDAEEPADPAWNDDAP